MMTDPGRGLGMSCRDPDLEETESEGAYQPPSRRGRKARPFPPAPIRFHPHPFASIRFNPRLPCQLGHTARLLVAGAISL